MTIKTFLRAIPFVVAGVMALPLAANAADGTISFNGQVLSQSCTVSTASKSLTVTLPAVSVGTLTAAGNTAGNTPFTIALTGCTPASGSVHTFFEAGSTTSADGFLSLTGRSQATNVKIALLNASDPTQKIAAGASDASQNSLPVAITADGTATLNYIAQYVATGTAGAGSASSTVQYTIVYQ